MFKTNMKRCDLMKKMNSKVVFLIKYLPLLLIIPATILHYVVDLSTEYRNDAIEILVALLPMVFTIISIALSLPSDEIYGVSSIKFRNIRRQPSFSFLEMIIITIGIFGLLIVFKVLNMVIPIWSLCLISVFYSFWFVIQEIPILTRSSKKIINTIKKSWEIEGFSKYKYGNGSKDYILDSIVQNVVIVDGIFMAYSYFKTDDKQYNGKLLEKLLSKCNDFLFQLADNTSYICNNSVSMYKGFSIIDVIDIALGNIENCLSLNKDFNVVEIFELPDKFYHITRMTFALKKITDDLNLKDKFNERLREIINTLFWNINGLKDTNELKFSFLCNYINTMLIYSLSDNDIWFLRILRNANYNSLFVFSDKIHYFYFVSFYIFWLSKVNKSVSKDLKDDISGFLLEEADGINADGSNWDAIFNHKKEYDSFNDMLNILPYLIEIFDTEKAKLPWYQPKHCTSWSSGDGSFNKDFLMNCWIELIVYNYRGFNYEKGLLNNVLEKLSENDRLVLAEVLSKKWFPNNSFKNVEKDDSILYFYDSRENIDLRNIESQIIIELKEFKNTTIKSKLFNEINNNHITEEELSGYKSILIDGFKKSASNLTILNKNIKIDSEPVLFFNCMFDIRFGDEIIKTYANRFDSAFRKILFDEISSSKSIKHIEINKLNCDEKIREIAKDYNCFSGNILNIFILDVSKDVIDLINKKEKVDIFTKELTFYKNSETVGINLKCCDDLSDVRWLTDSEINSIIDEKYKVSNGLYKYCDGSDESRSIYISRDELFELLYKKYCFAHIAFQKKTYIKYDEIVSLTVNE